MRLCREGTLCNVCILILAVTKAGVQRAGFGDAADGQDETIDRLSVGTQRSQIQTPSETLNLNFVPRKGNHA